MQAIRKGLLTIGIPTHNGADNLNELFASIQNLHMPANRYEILVVDNASDDNTDEVIEQLHKQTPNLRYYKNEFNIGRIQNWNKVIELTTGEYLILMNVNDRFLEFDVVKYLDYLDLHSSVTMLMADVVFEGYLYPGWPEKGILDLEAYLKKTFLDINYLEFNSLGVLQQHIFRTRLITDNHLRFDQDIPRTTDRVFTGETVKCGGGLFYYTPEPMVSWRLNSGRYHQNAHYTPLNVDDFWLNEYKANVKLGTLAGLSYENILRSQLILAWFLTYVKTIRYIKHKVFKISRCQETEVDTSLVYLNYLRKKAALNHVPINFFSVRLAALQRAALWFFRSLPGFKTQPRSLKNIIRYT